MTRQEAIEWVESIKERYIHGGDEGFDDARRKALDMAVEALSADTVSREQYDDVCEEYNRLVHKAVCIKLCDENCEYEKGKTCYHAREHSAIEALQAEPVKHGEWINKRLTKDSIKDIKDGTYGELIGYHDICSVCGFDIDEFWCATGSPYYCPNCGAKMEVNNE